MILFLLLEVGGIPFWILYLTMIYTIKRAIGLAGQVIIRRIQNIKRFQTPPQKLHGGIYMIKTAICFTKKSIVELCKRQDRLEPI